MEEVRHGTEAFEGALSHLHEDVMGAIKAMKLMLVDLGISIC